MEFLHRDCNERLVRFIPSDALGDDTAFFYLTRRHWLEIVPEAITSLFMLITWLALVNVLGDIIEDIFTRFFVAGFVAGLLFAFPFGIEIFRWQREIYYLTQSGYFHCRFDFRSYNQISEQIGWVVGAKAVRYGYYRMLGLDVGRFSARAADGRQVFSPLMPKPFVLQRRFAEIKNYQPKGK